MSCPPFPIKDMYTMKTIDLIGRRFRLLTVAADSGRRVGESFHLCIRLDVAVEGNLIIPLESLPPVRRVAATGRVCESGHFHHKRRPEKAMENPEQREQYPAPAGANTRPPEARNNQY